MNTMPIEVDITQVNKSWYSHRKKIDNTKHYVIGFLQRDGNCILKALDNDKPETIKEAVLASIEKGCLIYCEENILPDCVKSLYKVVEFSPTSAKGDAHINNLKNIWKSLKRAIKDEHISVSKKHLPLYCAEVEWRFNNRNLTPMERFNKALGMVAVTKHTTYKNLIK